MPSPRMPPAKISIDARHAFRRPGDGGQRAPAPHPCNCRKTRCLMMYCACFGNGSRCRTKCRCRDCANDGKHPKEHFSAVQHVLLRNNVKENGCQCVKSRCAKKYCVCMMQGRKCSVMCLCVDCSNMDWRAASSQKREGVPKKRPVESNVGGPATALALGASLPEAPDAARDVSHILPEAPNAARDVSHILPEASNAVRDVSHIPPEAPNASPDVFAPAVDPLAEGMFFTIDEGVMQTDSAFSEIESHCFMLGIRSTPAEQPFPIDVATCARTTLLRGIEERMGIKIEKAVANADAKHET